jgi:hypothetical protein
MSALQGFVGASYRSVAPEVNAEDCVNFQPEVQSSPDAKAPIVLFGSPGTVVNMLIGAGPIRAVLNTDDFSHVLSGDQAFRINPDGTVLLLGQVLNDGQNGVIVASTTQVGFISAGNLYVYDGITFQLIAGPWTTAADLDFLEGFWIVLDNGGTPVGGVFFISALNDATSWDALDFSNAPFSNNRLICLFTVHDELWILGSTVTQPFSYDPSQEFPFILNTTGVMQQGVLAKGVHSALDNTLYWLGQSQNGFLRAYFADGYTPKGISTPEIEGQWASYRNPSDAVGWVYELEGHAMFHINFQTAQKSWRYDISTKLWHRIAWRNPLTGLDECHRGNCHMVRAGKHLVGDRQTNQIWELSPIVYADGPNPLVASRTAPAPFADNKVVFYPAFELITPSGIGDGSNANPANGAVSPQANPAWMLSWSNDSGHTFGPEFTLPAGQSGQFQTRMRKIGCGSGRNRVFKVSISAAVPRCIIGAELPNGVLLGTS